VDQTRGIPDSAPDPIRSTKRGRRTAAGWAGLVLLALVVLVTGAVVGLLGPLLAIACASCQDAIRSPLRFGDALIVIAHDAVPIITVATVAGIFLPRGGARVGGIGLGILVLLFIVMLILGQFPA
jgi:hypothetical protein